MRSFCPFLKIASSVALLASGSAGIALSQSAVFTGFDTATKGSWVGTYGQDGYYIANDASVAPGYGAANFSGQSTWTWVASTSDVRALYSSNSTASNRIASTYYSSGTFNIDVNITDGQAHQIALYSLDLDTTSRNQTFTIVNGSTNVPLDSQTVTNFTAGVWAVWNVSGHVVIQVKNNGSSLNAVVSGIFFKTLGSIAKPVVSMNTPAQNPITGPIALSATATSQASIASVQFQVDGVNIGSPVTSGSGSTYTGQWSNPASGSHQLTAIATDTQGQSATSAAISVTVSLVASANSAAFVKTDTTTKGNWVGVYGGDGYIIPNDVTVPPSYASETTTGAQSYTWLNPTSDTRALFATPAGSSRIASTFYSSATFNFEISSSDGLTHQLALYCLDYETNQRAQTVTILDGDTSAVLSTQALSGMSGGIYAVWNISGHIIVRVTYSGGLNAVVAGVFFGGAQTAAPAPTVSITAPSSGTISGTVNVTSSAASSIGIASVQYYLDSVALGSPQTTGPAYSYSWNTAGVSNGAHTLTAIATDTSNQKSAISTGVSVNVSNSSVMPPTISITNPTGGTIAGSVNIQASASASSPATMSSVQFQIDGTALATVTGTGPTFSTSWNTSSFSNASHVITAIATDSLGHSASTTVTVTVSNVSTSTNTATFVKTDLATAGNWTGVYGGDGYLIANSASSLPGYASVTASASAVPYSWANPSSDNRALLTGPTSTTRIASTFYTSSSFTFDVTLSDGQTHQLALYSLDIETNSRAQAISILDGNTNAVLSTQNLTNFNSGVYAVWNISGHVIVKVAYTGGLNAVVSGLFFGSAGALPPLPTVSLASPAAGPVSGTVNITAAASSSVGIASVQYYLDSVALGSPITTGPSYSFAFDTTNAANGSHTLTAIAADTVGQHSATSAGVAISVSNAVATLPSVSITSPTGGTVSGTVTIQATASATSPATLSSVQFLIDGKALATVSGTGPSFSTGWNTNNATNAAHTITAIATDSSKHTKSTSVTVTVSNVVVTSNTATFVKADATTAGNWIGVYGADGYIIPNDASVPPGYATVSQTGGAAYSWFPSTTDPRALYTSPAGSNRIASAYYSTGSMTFDVNFNDGQVHQLAIYCLDEDTTTRTQTIQVIDATTSAVLDTEAVSNFNGGIYEVWNVSGHVLVQVTNTNNLNAVVSGLFFRSFAGLGNPVVTFVAPTANQTVSGPVTFTANATSAQGIASVQFSVDGTNVGAPLTGTGPSFTTRWASPLVSNGTHTISALVIDNLGLRTTISSSIQVSNGAAPTPSAVLTSIDSNTSGSWKGVYGQDGEMIAVDSTNPPFYATVNFVGTIDPPFTWHAGNPTTDIPGLQKALSNQRIGAAYYQIVPNATFNIDVNFVDYLQHELSLYFVDWHHNVRAQTVTIMDANTNAVLDTQYFTNFSLGIYYTWNIRGHVLINITLNPTPFDPDSAVVSGLFFQSASAAARPTVSISAPTPSQTLSQTVILTANASSPIGMSGVQFELDGYALGPVVSGGTPFTFQWNTTTVANGTHILNAIGIDSSNHAITSAPISVVVSN